MRQTALLPVFLSVFSVIEAKKLEPTAKQLGPYRDVGLKTAALVFARAETVLAEGEDVHLNGDIERLEL